MLALPALVFLPIAGGLLAWAAGRVSPGGANRLPWLIALATLVVDAALLVMLSASPADTGGWRAHFDAPWIPNLGISLRFDMDGLSLIMLWLTVVIAVPCVALSRREAGDRPGLYQFLILTGIAGINGVFIATDLFLFLFFWELMLVPMFVLILIWGHEERARAAIKFFLFTQAGGLVMLVAILALVLVNARTTGTLTFDYFALATTAATSPAAPLLMLGFALAFAVKLPVMPLHLWLPETYVQSPTAASVLLSGILAKTGGYGLIRFVVLFFPGAAHHLAPLAMALGVAGILYCAWLAAAQTDLKRLIAYSSVSHLGFVLLGVFSGSAIGMEGAIVQMVAHGLSTGALFLIAGALEERLGTRDMREMGGLWARMPKLSAMGMVFAAASLGLPGMGNFIGEFLVLLAVWHVSHIMTFFAATGLILSSIYSLTMMTKVFYGPLKAGDRTPAMPDGPFGHLAFLGIATVLLLALGIYPQPIIDLSAPAPALQTASRATAATGLAFAVPVQSAGVSGQ
ncbi:complex I subunit 4 family protein [Tanticharoenia sakaeratensis]|uniref:NADH-quinone oxidoreductase subunit M n=1 Tax=Tanticharoenia sakaeratensis NBRC 103193 TaxID=1231623 RepID=A0A0D6MJ97_9PROT|nr:NADH-quinone oxidoreductase subunit M [Tanticharoenia sakaeratensis]GAN53530.1 NADH-quinone oxidoreductase subunit M [Tanticharoenia sakaeratensis NBRC 103193]GBQ17639.1 NADH-quinone oxidoreductase chain M [Tanticharoenia sakaeratensis NBRC 103193]